MALSQFSARGSSGHPLTMALGLPSTCFVSMWTIRIWGCWAWESVPKLPCLGLGAGDLGTL